VSRLFEVIATKLNLPTSQPLGLLMKKGGASSQPASPGNTPLSEDWVRCVIESDAFVRVDGKVWNPRQRLEERNVSGNSSVIGIEDEEVGQPSRKRRRVDGIGGGGSGSGEGDDKEAWIVKTGQWRLRVRNTRNGKGGVECVLVAVRIEAVRSEVGRNMMRGFLGS